MQSGPLAAPGLYPVADAPEVFQGDTAAEPLRLGHYPFGDPVVDIPLVSPLPSGDLPELAPRRPRAPLLQASAPVDVDPPFFFHRLTAVGLRLAVREQVHRPQVAAQVILHGGGGRDVHLHHLMQDELAPPIAQHRLMATGQPGLRAGGNRDPKAIHRHRAVRSEEHTSELQSLAYLVCRLLLEKKKKKLVDITGRLFTQVTSTS